MQSHRIDSIKQYLLLIRLPNAFTAVSDILAGYFLVVSAGEANVIDLIPLMISSALLYIAGIALNDYFDVELDRRERPFRPLPSGRIPKQHALIITIIAFAAANTMASTVGLASLLISAVLTVTIIAYDYRVKRSFAGPAFMGGARSLNIFLGSSPLLFLSSSAYGVELAAMLLFAYIIAIMILSRKEVGDEKPNLFAVFFIVGGIIVTIAIAGLLILNFQQVFIVNLLIFAAVMVLTFKQLGNPPISGSIQNAIRNMVLSIIILDSIFVSGAAGIVYGIATLTLLVPAVVLAKKLYVT